MPACVFVLGSFAADMVCRVQRFPHPGETLLGTSFDLGPGGKGSNQAVAAARAGADVVLMSALSRDSFGEMARALWTAEGIDQTLVKVSAAPTGAAVIVVTETSGENAIVVVPGACGTFTPEDVEAAKEPIQRAKVFVAQLEVPIEAVWRGLEVARDAGVTTVLNPAPAPVGALPSEMLRLVDFLVPNETEARQLGRTDAEGEAAPLAVDRLLQAGCSRVLVTLGERGSVLYEAGRLPVQVQALCPGTVVDTTGAGDAFCGAFATALAEGRTPEAAARFASAGAGLSVTRAGAARSMPYRHEIEALLK